MALSVKIGGTPVNVVAGSLDIDLAVGERSTSRFTVDDRTGTYTIEQGSTVEVLDGATTSSSQAWLNVRPQHLSCRTRRGC